MSKPNIIFIQAESFDGRALGFLGHPALRRATPRLDGLAADGACFENTYCNFPLCCPSRASMWSGRFAHRVGAWNNYRGLTPETPTFATRLAAAGYTMGIIGKTDYLSGNHSGTARLAALSRAAAIPRPVHGENDPPTVYPDLRERAREGDWEKADQAREFLQRQRGDRRPFFLHVGFSLAHHSFRTSRHYLAQIPEDAGGLPREDTLTHPLLPLQRLQKNWAHATDPDGMRQRRRIYFAMIAELDALVGNLLQSLEQAGQRDNTWVIFTGDHGEMAGEHRQYIKLTPFEASMRVPLLVSGPGVRRGRRITAPVSLVDLHPTMLDLAGIERAGDLDGHSLLPELGGDDHTRRPPVFAEHHSTSCPTGTFMLRAGAWKLIACPGYPTLLFNLDQDPDELGDLSAAHPEKKREMEVRLRAMADYEAIDARAKAEDRRSFTAWRKEARRRGTYEQEMAATYSGAGHPPLPVQPWRPEDEERIRHWLAGNVPPLPAL